MKILLSTLIVIASLIPLSTQANIFDIKDYKNAGDSLIKYDSLSGLGWLSLTETYDMSVNEVIYQTRAGGSFEGWVLPSHNVVNNMLSRFFGSYYLSQSNPETRNIVTGDVLGSDKVDLFMTLFGYSDSWGDGVQRSYGVHASETGENYRLSGAETSLNNNHQRTSLGMNYSSAWFNHSEFTSTYKRDGVGIFLVSLSDMSIGSNISSMSDVSSPIVGIGSAFFIIYLISVRKRLRYNKIMPKQ